MGDVTEVSLDSAATAVTKFLAVLVLEAALKLYSFEISSRVDPKDYTGPRVKTLVTMSGDRGDDEGEWEASAIGARTLGLTAGYWQSARNPIESGFYLIRFTKNEQPSALRTLKTGARYDWDTLLTINDIMKWPLFVSETGSASTKADGNGYWRLAARGF